MTHRMKKNIQLLHALNQCSPAEQKQLLKVARPELIHAICDCIINVVHGKVSVSSYQKNKLRKNIGTVRQLCKHNNSAIKKKKTTCSAWCRLLVISTRSRIKSNCWRSSGYLKGKYR